jgi:hypothetical protein
MFGLFAVDKVLLKFIMKVSDFWWKFVGIFLWFWDFLWGLNA